MTIGTITGKTCNEACWYAREDVCRCSCGGASHGVLLREGVEQPRRNSRIKSHRYVLAGCVDRERLTWTAISKWAYERARERDAELRAQGVRHVMTFNTNGPGAIVWMRKATPQQVGRWPELSFARAPGHHRPTLIWVREEYAEAFDAAFNA